MCGGRSREVDKKWAVSGRPVLNFEGGNTSSGAP
jgi:hypothetical protein